MGTIAIDVHGQDGETKIAVNAAINFATKNPKTNIILVGKEEEINSLFNKKLSNIKIKHAPEIITQKDGILEIRRKTNSSLVQAINLVKDNKADAIVSAGASGPYMAATYLLLKTIKPDLRPAFSTILPTVYKNKYFILLDIGANSDTTSEQIVQFAIMGQSLSKAMELSIKPTVKLINNGIEESKGNEVYKKAHQLLKNNKKINFIGNLEPRYIMDGQSDVAVCGGFEGNIMSKTAEGVARAMSIVMKEQFKKNPKRIMGAILLKKALKTTKKTFDNRESGGGIILGVNGVALKTHGSVDAYGFEKSIEKANILMKNNILKNLKKDLK